jgi:hypothetical protein
MKGIIMRSFARIARGVVALATIVSAVLITSAAPAAAGIINRSPDLAILPF